jgi:peptidoglycan hydrolase-like protein with peptidoglycan-binding domain
MDEFRRAVAVLMRRDAPPPVVIPRAEPLDSHGPGRPTLRRGSVGPEVSLLREKLGLTPDSHFDAQTEAAVREFQRQHGLVPDGIVGPQTWSVLQPRPSPGS